MRATRAAINHAHLFILEPLRPTTAPAPLCERPCAALRPSLGHPGGVSRAWVAAGHLASSSTLHSQGGCATSPRHAKRRQGEDKEGRKSCVTQAASYHCLQLCNFGVNSQYKQGRKCFFRARLPVNCSLERGWERGWCTC